MSGRRPAPIAWVLTVTLVALAGCSTTPSEPADATMPAPNLDLTQPFAVSIENLMNFTKSVVTPAVGIAADLYEPTIEVSDYGTIYVAGHVIGAATTGTPVYYSRDDGQSWAQLPFLESTAAPSPIQGATPPPGDEGFLVAGEKGQAWMADIYAAGYSVTGWCDEGTRQCYDNRQAYDHVASTTRCNPAGVGDRSLTDRPWAAYASGNLLLVNNPGFGPIQIGIMTVPPSAQVGIAAVNGPTWNMCAGPGGDIPGVPAMRADGLFAVPQMFGSGDEAILNVLIGNKADIFDIETRKAFNVTSVGAGTTNGGRVAFDRDGTLYVGAKNNTKDNANRMVNILPVKDGRFQLAVSTDDAQTFHNATFNVGTAVRSLYLDGNMNGPGAILSWSQVGKSKDRSDWYVAHVSVGPDGGPLLQHVTLVVDEGPHSAGHVMGAAAGPDGRAYFVTFQDGEPQEYAGSTPISAWIQTEGPTLPATRAA